VADITDPYSFGPFRLDSDKHLILRNQRPINRSRQRFEIMKALIDAAGKTVSYDNFVQSVWNDGDITFHGVRRAVNLLKKDLHEYRDCIQCDPDRGYFFVKPPTADDPASPLEPLACPRGMDHEAWLSYRVGLQELARRTEESLRRALRNFEATLASSPDYVPAHINLAEALVLLSHTGYQTFDPRKTIPTIHRHLKHALIAGTDRKTTAAALSLSGKVNLLFFFDIDASEIDYNKALALDHTYAPIYHGLAHLYVVKGFHKKAFEAIQQAHEWSPLSPMIRATNGWLRYFTGRPEEGVRLLQTTLKVYQAFPTGHVMLGMNLEAIGRITEAIHHYKTALDLQHSAVPLACLGHVYGKLKRIREARRCEKQLRILSQDRFVSTIFAAHISVGLGDHEKAVAQLMQAYAEKADWLIYLGVDPRWQPLHSNKRFVALLKKIGIYRYCKDNLNRG
jgi:DNA-binding winged helix-turn-helix (wHTH) protein